MVAKQQDGLPVGAKVRTTVTELPRRFYEPGEAMRVLRWLFHQKELATIIVVHRVAYHCHTCCCDLDDQQEVNLHEEMGHAAMSETLPDWVV